MSARQACRNARGCRRAAALALLAALIALAAVIAWDDDSEGRLGSVVLVEECDDCEI